MVEGVAHLDGGVASPTHADLLLESGVDLAVVSAPMAGPSPRPIARFARRRLALVGV